MSKNKKKNKEPQRLGEYLLDHGFDVELSEKAMPLTVKPGFDVEKDTAFAVTRRQWRDVIDSLYACQFLLDNTEESMIEAQVTKATTEANGGIAYIGANEDESEAQVECMGFRALAACFLNFSDVKASLEEALRILKRAGVTRERIAEWTKETEGCGEGKPLGLFPLEVLRPKGEPIKPSKFAVLHQVLPAKEYDKQALGQGGEA